MRIALLAPFAEFSSTYSLAHVVCQQAELLRRGGHDVHVWTMQSDHIRNGLLRRLNPDVKVVPVLPRGQWEYGKVTEYATRAASAMMIEFASTKPDAVIAHDVCFQAWYTDVGFAVHQLQSRTASATWFHWLHSSPSVTPLDHDSQWRTRLPAGHFAIVPSSAILDATVQRYNLSPDRVFVVPNAHDIRWLNPLDPMIDNVVTRTRLLVRDAVQVYPLCLTRMHAKGLRDVMSVFDAMRRRKMDPYLIVAGANATAPDVPAEINTLRREFPELHASHVLYTHDCAAWRNGIAHELVMQLMALSNVFVFPSRAEACPLSLLEALQHRCTVVVNADVASMIDLAPNAIRHSFGGADMRPRAASVDGVKVTDRHGAEAGRDYDGVAEALQRAVGQDTRRVTTKRFGYEAVRDALELAIHTARQRRGMGTMSGTARQVTETGISVSTSLLTDG